jgi:hypothetical protein
MVGYTCFIIFQYYYLKIKILKFYENWNLKKKKIENFDFFRKFKRYKLYNSMQTICPGPQPFFYDLRHPRPRKSWFLCTENRNDCVGFIANLSSLHLIEFFSFSWTSRIQVERIRISLYLTWWGFMLQQSKN